MGSGWIRLTAARAREWHLNNEKEVEHAFPGRGIAVGNETGG